MKVIVAISKVSDGNMLLKTDKSKDETYFSHSQFLKGNQPSDDRFAMVAMMTDK